MLFYLSTKIIKVINTIHKASMTWSQLYISFSEFFAWENSSLFFNFFSLISIFKQFLYSEIANNTMNFENRAVKYPKKAGFFNKYI